jgi:hypothetical protein
MSIAALVTLAFARSPHQQPVRAVVRA